MLYQIDIESGRKTAQWLDAASYNKGWNDELMHGNIFYNIKKDEDLFVLGLMDTVMCIKKAEILPFLAIESERLVQKEDILEEEKIPTSDPRVRSKRMMSLLTRLSAQNKYYQIFNIFEHNSMLYFNCMGRMTDDVLFQMIPDHFQLPVFLSTDETGVYYYVPNGNLSELKYFMEENNISEEVVNRENIKKLDNDSNPVILYYEYKD